MSETKTRHTTRGRRSAADLRKARRVTTASIRAMQDAPRHYAQEPLEQLTIPESPTPNPSPAMPKAERLAAQVAQVDESLYIEAKTRGDALAAELADLNMDYDAQSKELITAKANQKRRYVRQKKPLVSSIGGGRSAFTQVRGSAPGDGDALPMGALGTAAPAPAAIPVAPMPVVHMGTPAPVVYQGTGPVLHSS